MKRFFFTILALAMTAAALQAKTLVVYYSFTNHCRTIANEAKTQLKDADIVEVQPADEGLDYAANGYKIGADEINAIKANPNSASAYPGIKDIDVDLKQYDEFVIVTPLWHSQMAAPMQAFLFHNGKSMTGKRVGLIVSSASSGISGVEADAKRLVPQGDFAKSLWIRSSQTANSKQMIATWIAETGIGTTSGIQQTKEDNQNSICISGNILTVNGSFKSVDIYDANGRKLMSSTEKATDISALAANVYIAVVRGGKSSGAEHKFVVK